MAKDDLTIIDSENLRGIVGPASSITEEMLEDMADIVRYADPRVRSRIERKFRANKLSDGRALRKKLGA
ncbi:hypothetical protein A3B35_01260 [Candidatus Kaiserbacteria bacterium RIFCSPLOWO2_01_FULL_54_24]|uniref:Uncharacterized protein n=1 Tax=Candidatus Kaiserbacteria bacterium RIFCSPLOWO2_01_FULL_54_24 TaxID=1798515 RepID=A0A1F6EUU6_9BACT|nr:MAG: hypothetical protein A3B35_01260 [Candidatus Kaiserbacteria bacterium RIFCSPLOWO2_01_FULL_54_24]